MTSAHDRYAQRLATRLAKGPAPLELDEAVELFWDFQDRIGTCDAIGVDDGETLLRVARDADVLASICRAIVAGEELFWREENRASSEAEKQAAPHAPLLHA